MTYFKEFASGLFLALLCLLIWDLDRSVATVNAELPGILSNVKSASNSLPDTMNSVKQSADTANMVSTESLDLVGSMTKLVDKSGGLLNQTSAVVYHADASLIGAVPRFYQTANKLDSAIDAVATVPPNINKALAPLPAFEQSLTHTSDAAGNFINNPFLNKAVENVATLAGNAAEITDNTNNYFFPPPYSGPHPILHRAKRIGEGALKLAPGLAGGIAIAKGN
jgi:hypothetical protein